jgi:hypothetical protein
MAFIYILYSSKLDKYYIGTCFDLERRLYEHNIGHSKFTSLGTLWITSILLGEQFSAGKDLTRLIENFKTSFLIGMIFRNVSFLLYYIL